MTERAPLDFPRDGNAEWLTTYLAERLHGRVQNLQVTITGQRMILRGRASSVYAKQLAQHAILEVTDQFTIENRIGVSQSLCAV